MYINAIFKGKLHLLGVAFHESDWKIIRRGCKRTYQLLNQERIPGLNIAKVYHSFNELRPDIIAAIANPDSIPSEAIVLAVAGRTPPSQAIVLAVAGRTPPSQAIVLAVAGRTPPSQAIVLAVAGRTPPSQAFAAIKEADAGLDDVSIHVGHELREKLESVVTGTTDHLLNETDIQQACDRLKAIQKNLAELTALGKQLQDEQTLLQTELRAILAVLKRLLSFAPNELA
jgi:hypothetical protein